MADPMEADGAATSDAGANSQAEAPSKPQGGDDLDDLLAEFDTGTAADDGTEPPVEAPAPAPAAPPRYEIPPASKEHENIALHNWAMSVESERQHAREVQDTLTAIRSVRGEMAAEMYPDSMIAGWLTEQAQANPAVQAAWQNRGADPKTFQRTLDRLGRDFQKTFGVLPDANATEDRAAVTAAVRGASKAAPPDDNGAAYARRVSRMSDAEYRKHIEETHGYSPNV